MSNFLNKKLKFENSLYILYCLIGVIYGIITMFSDKLDGIRIFSSNTLGLILLIISSGLLLAEVVLLTIYNPLSSF